MLRDRIAVAGAHHREATGSHGKPCEAMGSHRTAQRKMVNVVDFLLCDFHFDNNDNHDNNPTRPLILLALENPSPGSPAHVPPEF